MWIHIAANDKATDAGSKQSALDYKDQLLAIFSTRAWSLLHTLLAPLTQT